MAKVKLLDLAREVGMEDDKLLLKLKRMGVKVKKPTEPEKKVSPLEEKVIERDGEKEIVEKRIKPTVIRRRTRTLEVKAEVTEPLPPPPPPVEPVTTEEVIGKKVKKKPAKVEEEVKEVKKEKKARVKSGRKKTTETTPAPVLETPLETEPPVIKPASKREEEKISPPQPTKADEGPTSIPTPKVKEMERPKVVEEPKLPEIKITDKEEMIGKRKGFIKKRRLIEERLIIEKASEKEVFPEKEIELAPRPYKPMKKKVVLKTPKKTEVTVPKPIKRIIRIAEVITVSDLAKRMGVKGGEVIKKLMDLGVFVNINQVIDADVASLVASEFGYEVEKVSLEREDLLERKEDRPEELEPRPPVVTIMGHVDHGKTMLLDSIRKTNVIGEEAGGITQHIGAYDVKLENGHIVFIDTPGHEAFTALRARGAKVTDIVVLVVAADDGVMPQTREAIDHARAANVPIIVAINKIDKPNANPEKVKKELSEYGLVPEQWGGNTLYAEVSAKQKIGIKELLDLILLQAEVLELKANPNKLARGTIIESRLDKGRGPVATVLIQEGTLRTGDVFIAGSHYGRVRAMLNDRGQKMEEAKPSIPVEVVGFNDIPEAGDSFIVVPEERIAKQITLYRHEKMREKELSRLSKVSLQELYEKIKKGEVKELNVIIKADVQGSIEAVKESLKKLSTDTVKVNILHGGIGGITETDVNLASASNAIIIGFNVRPSPKAQSL
ncbi:MAG: translation initiation factor IF-2, partial [Thermodesulfobacteriota bacterium]